MHKYVIIIIAAIIYLYNLLIAQDDPSSTIGGIITQEYCSNFIRLPDSLKLSDYRMNIILNANHQRKILQNGSLGLQYEMRYHHYREYHHYNRYDHQTNFQFQKPIIGDVKLHLANELRLRFSSTTRFSYYRNIVDFYINLPITLNDRAYIGFQNWAKDYPRTSEYQKYRSSRVYAKLSLNLTNTTTLGIKAEFHLHEGNLYPGSTAGLLKLDIDGTRYIFQAVIDKIIHRKIFTSFAYRFENDVPADVDNEQTGEQIGDENYEDLLAEDSDFGYLKNQVSLSTIFKLNPSISIMAFYLLYKKNFRYWYIEPEGPKRQDRLVFISHILKIKLYKNLTLEFQHNYEENDTNNLKFYQYYMNLFSAGVSIQY